MTPDSLPQSCDVVVVGSGAAGLTSALVSATLGLDVIVCEKSERIGGTTAMSGGTCWVPGNHLAFQNNSAADVDAARSYLNAEIGDNDPYGVREAFLRSARESFEFLDRHSDVKFTAPAHYPDYHPGVEGAVLGGRAMQPLPFDGRLLGGDFKLLSDPLFGMTILGGMMVSRTDAKLLARPFESREALAFTLRAAVRHFGDRLRHARGTRLLLGNALIARFLFSLRRKGVPIFPATAMSGLIVDNRSVVGVRFGERRVAARKGVILATGGFTSSSELRRKLLPEQADRALSAPGATGDGWRAARAAGARVAAGHAAPAFYMPVSELRVDDRIALFPHVIIDRARPGVIAVDQNGRRFVNEGDSYHDFAMAMLNRGIEQAFLICDRPSLRRYGLGLVRPVWQWLPYYLSRKYLVSAETLGELAGRSGIDATGLEATIETYNRDCAAGVDRLFGKGSSPLNLMYGDSAVAPNPCLAPIATPPFFAVAVKPAAIGSSIGIDTDADARVLNEDGVPVRGLFACGNDAASIMHGRYPGAGITLGPAITFAYLAARRAAS